MADLSDLMKPFGGNDVKSRKGGGGKTFAYVAGKDILGRVIEATRSEFDWTILKIRYSPGLIRLNTQTSETYTTPGVWLVHGRLNIPEMGSKDGIGTAIEENEDAAKAAETDAFKRCATKFGIALDIEGAAATPPTTGVPSGVMGAINTSAGLCPYCNCPAGKPHTRTCQSPACK